MRSVSPSCRRALAALAADRFVPAGELVVLRKRGLVHVRGHGSHAVIRLTREAHDALGGDEPPH